VGSLQNGEGWKTHTAASRNANLGSGSGIPTDNQRKEEEEAECAWIKQTEALGKGQSEEREEGFRMGPTTADGAAESRASTTTRLETLGNHPASVPNGGGGEKDCVIKIEGMGKGPRGMHEERENTN
jgi:hypothetical protein